MVGEPPAFFTAGFVRRSEAGTKPVLGSSAPAGDRRSSSRVRPVELEPAAQEAGQPFGLLLGGAPDPVRTTREGLDPDGQLVSSALVPPDALHAGVDQHYRLQPALRAVDVALQGTGQHGLAVLVLVVAGSRRLSTAADYLGWQARRGTSLFNVQLGWAFVVSLLAMFGSAIYIAIELGRDGRRVRSR